MSRTRALRTAGAAVAAGISALVIAVSVDARGSTSSIRNGGTLVIGLASDADSLDPTFSRLVTDRMVFAHMCEKLYDLNAKLQIVPQLAASLPQISNDKLTYTIPIRTGIKFNDGTPLTPAAVKQSIDRHRTAKGSVRASEVSPIDSILVQGNSVVIHLKDRSAPLLSQLADRAGMVMSPRQLSALGDKFTTHPVCVGPFEFKDRSAGDHITLVKSNDYYGKAKVHLDQIVFRVLTDGNARTQDLRAGDIQVAPLQATDVATLRQDKNFTVLKSRNIGWQGLILNIGNKNGLLKPYANVGTPLARSQYLRTAFDLALDRTAINRVVFEGLNDPDCYPISAISPWYVTTKGLQCNVHANVDLARKLVKASGIPTPIKVTLTIGTSPQAARLGAVIQSMENEVGFAVTLKSTEAVAALNAADAGNFDVWQQGWSGRVDPDGNIYGWVTTSGTLNDSGYSNPKLDYVLSGARRSIRAQDRITLYRAAMKIIRRDRPIIYLWHGTLYTGVSKKVTGVAVYGDGLIRASNAGYVK